MGLNETMSTECDGSGARDYPVTPYRRKACEESKKGSCYS